MEGRGTVVYLQYIVKNHGLPLLEYPILYIRPRATTTDVHVFSLSVLSVTTQLNTIRAHKELIELSITIALHHL